MDKAKKQDSKRQDEDKVNRRKPDEAQPTAGGPHEQPWPPSSGPGERSDKDAIGRPVQLDKD